MIDKDVPIIPNSTFIKIVPYKTLIELGYEKDHPEIFICADKTYRVKDVTQIDSDLRHVRVYDSDQVFIDADIASVTHLD